MPGAASTEATPNSRLMATPPAVWPLVPLTMLCGLGFGLFQVPNNRNMFLSAPADRAGAAGGLQATARLSGQTAGGVAMSLLFSVASVDAAPGIALAIGAVLSLVAGLVSLWRVEPPQQAGTP
jgi:MFS transporter, DHA2 family, multidrug resistance protein